MCVAQHIQLGIQEKLQDESLALGVSELTPTLPQAEAWEHRAELEQTYTSTSAQA
jgi:hypothetical protein